MTSFSEVVEVEVDYAVERRGRLDVARRGPRVTPGAYCDACGELVCPHQAWIGEPAPHLLRAIRERQQRYMAGREVLLGLAEAPRQLYSEYVSWRSALVEKSGRPEYVKVEVGVYIARACSVGLGPGWERRTWVALTPSSWLVRTSVASEMKAAGWMGFEYAEVPLRSGAGSPFSLMWVSSWRTDVHWLDGVPFAADEVRCGQCKNLRGTYVLPARAAIPANRTEPQVFELTPWAHGAPYVTKDVADWIRARDFPDCRVVECTEEEAIRRVPIAEWRGRHPDIRIPP